MCFYFVGMWWKSLKHLLNIVQLSSAESTGLCCASTDAAAAFFFHYPPPKKKTQKISENVPVQPLDQIQALVWMNSMLVLPEQSAAVHRFTCSVCLPQFRQHLSGEASS